MTGSPHGAVRFALQPPQSWLGRAAFVLAAATLAALAFFFVVVFLVAGAIFAVGLLARWWWLLRKPRRAQAAGSIEGEYVVVTSDGDAQDRARVPDRPRALPHDGNSR